MKNIILLILILMCSGCSNKNLIVPEQKSNLTVGMIKKELVKGKTSQNDVITLFGAPNIITTNAAGNEVWNYSKSSYQSGAENKNSGWSLLLLGSSKSSVLSNASTASMDLIIIFDSKGIVKDYKVISSAF